MPQAASQSTTSRARTRAEPSSERVFTEEEALELARRAFGGPDPSELWDAFYDVQNLASVVWVFHTRVVADKAESEQHQKHIKGFLPSHFEDRTIIILDKDEQRVADFAHQALITAMRRLETALRAHTQGLMEVATP